MAGMKERMAGKFMQWEGKATGDPVRRAEGKLVAALGRLKQAASKLRRPRRAPRADRRDAPRRGGTSGSGAGG